MLAKEKVMEILEAYDLTQSYRATAALVGCDHHTVRRYVAARAAGLDPLAAAANYYGVTIATCLPADPESKGGSEATVRIAKADLVPTACNLGCR